MSKYVEKFPKHTHRQTLRTWVSTSFQMSIVTGAETNHKKNLITDRCSAHLWSGEEKESGVCKGCSKGSELPTNRFATEEEKEQFSKTGRITIPILTEV